MEDPGIDRVRSVARRPLPPRPKLTHTVADLREPVARQALAGVDVLWHLGFQLWRRSRASAGMEVNLDGSYNVLAARPGHVVLASSAAVYGAWPDNPLPIEEGQPPRPNPECVYARQKLELEHHCPRVAPTATLRLSAVLGPGADSGVARATARYRFVVPAVRGVSQALQFMFEDDAVRALHAAGIAGITGTVNVAPDDWLTEQDIAGLTGGRVVRLPPRLLLQGAELAFRFGLVNFGADRAVLLQGPLALDTSHAYRLMGWRAQRSSADTLSHFLAWSERSSKTSSLRPRSLGG